MTLSPETSFLPINGELDIFSSHLLATWLACVNLRRVFEYKLFL